MRVLLDECVPKQVMSSLAGHEVRTVGRMVGQGKRTVNFSGWPQPDSTFLLQ
jgi:hypothetical protein